MKEEVKIEKRKKGERLAEPVYPSFVDLGIEVCFLV
jgi:hypothetical protein